MLLALASARAFEISKGSSGAAQVHREKNAGRPLLRFPARRGCPASGLGSHVLSAATEAAAVSHSLYINLNPLQNTAGLLLLH